MSPRSPSELPRPGKTSAKSLAGNAARLDFRTPFLLIGSHRETASQMLTQSEELGITSYVVRERGGPDMERVLARIDRKK